MMRRAQPALGTLVDIGISDMLDHEQTREAFRSGFAVIHEIHQLMSFHVEDSDIGRYNRAAIGDVIHIHAHTAAVLAAASHLSAMSEGLFDIRVGSRLVELGYLPAPANCANQSRFAVRRESGVQSYRLLPDGQVKKLGSDWLDVGGIAKGYAVDCAIAVLQALDIQHACVNAGGDLRVLGQGHAVVIRDPQIPQMMAKQLILNDRAMATSASYFSGKVVDGIEVSALVDGSTGRAITADRSYTVLAPACIWADALTKVVAASSNAGHPCLSHFGAEAFII